MAHPALHSSARLLARALLAFACLAALPAGAQDSMQQLRQQLAADKKQLVTANMDLTAQEAAAFWHAHSRGQGEGTERAASTRLGRTREAVQTSA
jgi:hypothetical protein